MKKAIFTILALCLVYFQSNAQRCSGGSGNTACTAADTATMPGLAPTADSLAPLVNGTSAGVVIQFENFDSVPYNGQYLHVTGLVIDTISNLPNGTCWASNVANDSFPALGYGCIALNGFVCDTPGQYKLYIKVTVYTHELSFGLPVSADLAGLYYYVRVRNASDTITPIDTTGEAAGTISKFISYHQSITGCTVGINEVAPVNALSIRPNPFSTSAIISFSSNTAGKMTEKLTNIIGSEVYRKELDVIAGSNTHNIERGNLSPGIYFYTISDGISVYTQRLVITD